jgi:hypothetical protein
MPSSSDDNTDASGASKTHSLDVKLRMTYYFMVVEKQKKRSVKKEKKDIRNKDLTFKFEESRENYTHFLQAMLDQFDYTERRVTASSGYQFRATMPAAK